MYIIQANNRSYLAHFTASRDDYNSFTHTQALTQYYMRTHSPTHSPAHSLTRPLAHVHTYSRTLAHSLTYTPNNPLSRVPNHWLAHPITHSLIHSPHHYSNCRLKTGNLIQEPRESWRFFSHSQCFYYNLGPWPGFWLTVMEGDTTYKTMSTPMKLTHRFLTIHFGVGNFSWFVFSTQSF